MKKSKRFYLYHAPTNTHTFLSSREVDCIGYLLRGKSLKQMGKLLCLSPRTIEFHIRSLKEKLDCHTKAELIEKILLRTLIDQNQSQSETIQIHQQLKLMLHQWPHPCKREKVSTLD